MKTLRILSSDIVETAFVEPAVHHHTIGQHLSGDGNRIIALRVGPAGIIVTDGKDSVAIPSETIYAAVGFNAPVGPQPSVP